MNTAAQMNCQELVELVTEYLEETLPAADRSRFEDHLGTCPYCVTYLEQMRITVESLGELDADQLSRAARDALLYAFRDWKEAAS